MLDDATLLALLDEDAPYGDLSTEALGIGQDPGHLVFGARTDMVPCGLQGARRLLELSGASARCDAPEGTPVRAGTQLLQAEGNAGALHRAWKVAQYLVEHLSGIATATRALCRAADPVPVACTRRGFPGTRRLAAYAVRTGGGTLHRTGLSDTLLVTPEHRGFLPASSLTRRLLAAPRVQPGKKLVIAVNNEAEALRLADQADMLQLIHFSPDDLGRVRQRLDERPRRPLLAPAGGVSVELAAAYRDAGADLLISSQPLLTPPLAIKAVLQPAG